MALTDSINNNGSSDNEEKELVQFEQCQKENFIFHLRYREKHSEKFTYFTLK